MYNSFILLYSRNITLAHQLYSNKTKKKIQLFSFFKTKSLNIHGTQCILVFTLYSQWGKQTPSARKPCTYTDLKCNMTEGCSGEVCKQPWGPRTEEIIVRPGESGKAAQGRWNAPQFQKQTGRQHVDMCKGIQVQRTWYLWVQFGWISETGVRLVQCSHSVVSDSLQLHGLKHARLPCPSPPPGAYSNSCPSSRWCHPTIPSSVVPFSSCFQSFLVSGPFPMSQFFPSCGQSIGASASASVLRINTQD